MDEEHSSWYAEHFRELAREGADLSGEARLVDIDSILLAAARVDSPGPAHIKGDLAS